MDRAWRSTRPKVKSVLTGPAPFARMQFRQLQAVQPRDRAHALSRRIRRWLAKGVPRRRAWRGLGLYRGSRRHTPVEIARQPECQHGDKQTDQPCPRDIAAGGQEIRTLVIHDLSPRESNRTAQRRPW